MILLHAVKGIDPYIVVNLLVLVSVPGNENQVRDVIQIPVTIGGFQTGVLFGYGYDFTFNGVERADVASTQKQAAERLRTGASGRKVDRDKNFIIGPVKT